MKKLLVAAIGAAVAFGAFAENEISLQRFKNVATGSIAKENLASVLNTAATPAGTYWSDPADITNEYTVSTVDSITCPGTIDAAPGKALDIKTKFGKPLSLNIVSGGTTTNIPSSGLYFDSLVKFTVCDSEPDQTYAGAKIIMWLQETETEPVQTNLYVRAGYLSKSGNTVVSTPTNYVCAMPENAIDIDGLNRVTIKAIADITSTGLGVPGFAIYVNRANGATATTDINCLADKWDSSFDGVVLTEAAEKLNDGYALFPTLDLTSDDKDSLKSVAFDGTGSITDIRFTDVAPTYAADMATEKASVVDANEDPIEGSPFTDLAAAIAAIETAGAGTYTMALSRDVELDDTLTINSVAGVNIVLDFNGMVITYAGSAAAIVNDGNLTITDSSGNKTGGIRCTGSGNALAQGGNRLTINAGNFWGNIDLSEVLEPSNVQISGGSFQQDDMVLGEYLAVGTKMVEDEQTQGWFHVVPATYTITFISGEGSATNKYEDCTYEQVINVPTPAVVVGKTFSAWSPAIDGATVTATADATYTAVYEAVKVNVIFVDGDTATTNGVDYGTTLTAESAPAFVGRTGYTAAWDKTVAGTTVTEETTFTAQYTANTYTVTFYTNSVPYAVVNYTYADASSYSAPADPSVDGYTFGGWFTDNSTFEDTFVFSANVAGNTQVAYAKLTQSGGGSDWDPDPSVIPGDRTAAAEYPALADTPLATANAKKLTVWAKANGVDFGDVKSATTDIVDSYLLNCSEAQLESAKAAFAIPSITFDEDGKPVIAEPTGNYNGTIQKKGSDNLSTWTVIDGSTHKAEDFQFFKLELVLP